MPLFIRMERPFWGLISLRNKQYWQSRSTITALLLAVLFISGHLIANAGYDADGGKHLTGFYFFSPYMNWLPIDISSSLPVAWNLAAPLLSVLAGGMIAASHGRSGYAKLMRFRHSFVAYRRSVFLAAGVLGAIVPIMVLGFDFLGLLAIHPNVLPNQWLNNNVAISYLGLGGNLFYTHTWAYMLGWIALLAFYGASYAIFSNFLYFVTGKMVLSLMGVMMVQLILLSISIIFKTSLAPITYLQIVPTIGQPSLVYVLLWPAILIAMSLFSFRVPKIEA